jgi:hypothetical protein
MNHCVVVYPDTLGKYLEGDIVSLNEENAIRVAGGACLPIDLKSRAYGLGFAFMKWGRAGIRSTQTSSKFTEIVVPCASTHRRLTWIARIDAIDGPAVKTAAALTGQVSFTACAPAWSNTVCAGFSSEAAAIQVKDLGNQNPGGGWWARGRGMLVIPGSGAYAFSLFGVLNGARVSSLAVSTTEE